MNRQTPKTMCQKLSIIIGVQRKTTPAVNSEKKLTRKNFASFSLFRGEVDITKRSKKSSFRLRPEITKLIDLSWRKDDKLLG